jgi:hypothetical protein
MIILKKVFRGTTKNKRRCIELTKTRFGYQSLSWLYKGWSLALTGRTVGKTFVDRDNDPQTEVLAIDQQRFYLFKNHWLQSCRFAPSQRASNLVIVRPSIGGALCLKVRRTIAPGQQLLLCPVIETRDQILSNVC